MQMTNYGMGYCPPQQSAKKDLEPHFQFDTSVLIVVVVAAVVGCSVIAYDRMTGIFAYRKRMKARKHFNKGHVAGWVFRDRESMAMYLRMDLGYEPEPWRIEMLERLLDARIAAFKRKNIGKYGPGFDIKAKIVEEP